MLMNVIPNGDATDPIGSTDDKVRVIAHCCNDVGAWGAGFVLALSKKWPEPEAEYRRWARERVIEGMPFKLGQCHLVRIPNTNISVANIIGQSGCGMFYGLPPIRYGAIHEGFIRLRERMSTTDKWSLHMPKMGCGLAGGKWHIIKDIISDVFRENTILINVYDR